MWKRWFWCTNLSIFLFFFKGLKDKKESGGNHTMVADKAVCILNLNMACHPAVLNYYFFNFYLFV